MQPVSQEPERTERMSNVSWYVLQSVQHKENQLCQCLLARGLECFYPTITVKPVDPRSSKIRPYFPGYLFVRADLEEIGLSKLQWLPGAVGLVCYGEHPAPVPDHVIYKLKAHLAANGTSFLTRPELKMGDRVRVIDGPLAGYEAIFDTTLSGHDRVRILLDILGRQVRTTLCTDSIEKLR